MDEILAAILQFIGEFLLQIVFEALAELGLHSIKAIFEESPHPIFASVGYIIIGVAAGGISLLIVPHLIIHRPIVQVINLVLSPLACGAVMAAVGALRRRHDWELIRLDRFGYGAVFALSMSMVRFHWGT